MVFDKSAVCINVSLIYGLYLLLVYLPNVYDGFMLDARKYSILAYAEIFSMYIQFNVIRR